MNKNLQDFVGKYKERVDRGIADELTRRLAEVKTISLHLVPIIEAMKELSTGGKRIRAMLVILGYQLSGKEVNDEIIRAAVAIELFHLGLLIQDDWMDRDQLRRGVRVLHTRYPDPHVGNAVAMLAGDYTFGWTIEILAGLRNPELLQVWGKYFTRVGYGQTLDGLDIADDRTILQILAIKSGEYSCVLPLLLGATLGGADTDLINKLEQYGMELGMVFQLRDDWLGYDKDMAKKGKKTYATMYGKENAEEAIKKNMMIGKDILRGFSSKYGGLLDELLDWVGTREN